MLTGELPFTASDPMEWVHCHIARQPAPPQERIASIPAPLSAIVMKLLAKNAEDRYQTAAGLTPDLRKCLAEWESHRSIEPFPLGADDVSDRLAEHRNIDFCLVQDIITSLELPQSSGRPERLAIAAFALAVLDRSRRSSGHCIGARKSDSRRLIAKSTRVPTPWRGSESRPRDREKPSGISFHGGQPYSAHLPRARGSVTQASRNPGVPGRKSHRRRESGVPSLMMTLKAGTFHVRRH
jgi:serine/threonine protein kinase